MKIAETLKWNADGLIRVIAGGACHLQYFDAEIIEGHADAFLANIQDWKQKNDAINSPLNA